MKKRTINVEGKSISVITVGTDDYISLTEMVKGEEGNDHIRNWMRNRNTIEYLGTWETLYNQNFKGVEFDTFKVLIIQSLPSPQIFNGVSITHPISNVVITFFTFNHFC